MRDRIESTASRVRMLAGKRLANAVLTTNETYALAVGVFELTNDVGDLLAEIDRLTAELAAVREMARHNVLEVAGQRNSALSERDAAIRERDARPEISREDAGRFLDGWADSFVMDALRAHAAGVSSHSAPATNGGE